MHAIKSALALLVLATATLAAAVKPHAPQCIPRGYSCSAAPSTCCNHTGCIYLSEKRISVRVFFVGRLCSSWRAAPCCIDDRLTRPCSYRYARMLCEESHRLTRPDRASECGQREL
ncbi:hypothetical protein PLICRDRAFT_45074 [Plicaturopsis crispa FD-325 SS-3]|nr:hypothetical protein PLICRDRAFT_45074 [Plicaturopsis crispa FD-325 SS-3]